MRPEMLLVRGVHYRILTAGTGLPVLLLHGFTGSADVWRQMMQTDSEFQWIAPDLLGHGETDSSTSAERYDINQQVDDIMEFMNQLGINEFACIGYSMGGRVALSMAVNYSKHVKALVLESSSPGLASETERQTRRRRDNALANRIEDLGVQRFVSEWEQVPLFATQSKLREDTLQTQRDIRQHQVPHGLANSLRGMGTGVQPSYWNVLHKIQAPVLLVTGAKDKKFTDIAVEMSGLMSTVQHESIADSGHTVHLEHPAAFRSTVLSFLKLQYRLGHRR